MNLNSQLEAAVSLAKQAGDLILEVYESEDFDITLKSQNSPLTRADMTSHRLITSKLEELSDVPVLSEESKSISYETRTEWNQYWLVDPLDGTKEFIKRNGEFTINIALIQDGNPVLGVIHAPVLDLTYYALQGGGAFRQKVGEGPVRIGVNKALTGKLKIVTSRSHAGPEVERFLARISDYECLSVGSSLKFCAVAEGAAHIYPRFGPTMEWDTAAGQCIAEEADAIVADLQGKPLTYNKPSLLNPHFVVVAAPLNWQEWFSLGPGEQGQ